jgi:hypothetical protein
MSSRYFTIGPEPAGVAWIGLSLHYLLTPAKVIGDAGAAQHRRGSRPIPNKRGRQSRRRGPRRLAAPVGSPEAIVDRVYA